ncbi:MAG: chromosome segregation protein SMC [Clostridia bacterium]
MRLIKLDLFGFKSFARKTEIAFGDGVTAVIGPNGSGKSNISDAIRWVLGEQSAKALRGAKMEDVIFNGTEQRKAQAYCEVTLTFDNADGKLNIPYAEVAITRRVYRSGESEYCINKSPCRLKDVQELFRDTGIGKDGYSIISQGKVDEILSNKSNERRAALEEAAGVMRYRARKEESERKLENTEKNLERIEDIVKELSDRLGPLEEQSASARAYLRLHDELKDQEVNLFLYQYERNNERLIAIKDAIEQMRDEQTLSGASEQTLLEECAALEEQVHALDASLSEQQNKLMALLSKVESHVGESHVLTERRAHAQSECMRIAAERQANADRRTELMAALEHMEADDAQTVALSMLDTDIVRTEKKLTLLDARVEQSEADLETLKNSIMEAMNRMSDFRSDISRFDAMKAAIETRLTALNEEESRQETEKTRLQQELSAAEQLHGETFRQLSTVKNNFEGAIAHRYAVQDAYSCLQEQTQKDEQQLSSLQSRLHVLQEMSKSREGYYASVKNILRDADRDTNLSRAIVGVVAELIRVPKEYETAVTMALGSSLQNIVTPTAEDAKYVIEYLRRQDYGRATLLPMTLLNPGRISQSERGLLEMPGVIGVGSELVDCDANVRAAVDHLLGRTVIVNNLDSGIALKKRSHGAFHIATLEGDIISSGGSMSGGSMQKRSFSLLGREREMAELTASVMGREKSLASSKESLREKERELLQCDVQVDAFRNTLHGGELEQTKQNEQMEIIKRDADNAAQKRALLAAERVQLNENINDIEQNRIQAESEQTAIAQGNAVTREDVINAQSVLSELRLERESVSTELTEQKVRRMALVKERDAVQSEHKRLQNEREQTERACKKLDDALQENQLLMSSVDVKMNEMLSGISAEQEHADTEKECQRKMEEERAKLSDSLSEMRVRRETMLSTDRDLSDRLHKQELLQSRLEMELANMQDHIWEEYELTYENALAFKRELAIGTINTRIGEIKTEIRALGDINLSAIDDYKAVLERYTSLHTQCEDLLHAKADLETLIVELTDTMQVMFLRQFKEIQQNFSKVFSELFGGGHAELRLADQDDVLACDIDIIAQPPGKKLQLLSLLSGGERALTAIALLFAMLKLKPPAFCVLDEIESSLDEVNVTRFADYVKAYSDETQFILITHRKGSMEVCNILYGVSMEEKGISKIVSAKFGEAAS